MDNQITLQDRLRALGIPDWATARVMMGEAADHIDILEAKLAALESQEPVAWMGRENGITYMTSSWNVAKEHPETHDTPLYLAAGAKEQA